MAILAFGAGFLAIGVATGPAAAGANTAPVRPVPSPANSILTVQGTAEVKTAPDTARVRLGVQFTSPTAAEASKQEANSMAAVVQAIRNIGVAGQDIQTSDLSLDPVYENRANEQPQLKGFQATNIVTATIKNPADVGPIIDAALNAGANRVDSISFFKQDDSAERDQALREAAQAAARKARVLAEALGVTLEGVASISEGVASLSPTPFAGRAMMGAAATPVMSGQVSVTATVTVEYHIK
jgi:uncharacterized protein YggE